MRRARVSPRRRDGECHRERDVLSRGVDDGGGGSARARPNTPRGHRRERRDARHPRPTPRLSPDRSRLHRRLSDRARPPRRRRRPRPGTPSRDGVGIKSSGSTHGDSEETRRIERRRARTPNRIRRAARHQTPRRERRGGTVIDGGSRRGNEASDARASARIGGGWRLRVRRGRQLGVSNPTLAFESSTSRSTTPPNARGRSIYARAKATSAATIGRRAGGEERVDASGRVVIGGGFSENRKKRRRRRGDCLRRVLAGARLRRRATAMASSSPRIRGRR